MTTSATAATPPTTRELDNCRVCGGYRGGVPGNGNVVENLVVCDYCSARCPKLPLGLVQARAVAMYSFGLSEQLGLLTKKLSDPAVDVGTPLEILARMRSLVDTLVQLQLMPDDLPWRTLQEYAPERTAQVLAFSRDGSVSEKSGAHLQDLAWAAELEDDDCYYTHWAPMPAGPRVAATAHEEHSASFASTPAPAAL